MYGLRALTDMGQTERGWKYGAELMEWDGTQWTDPTPSDVLPDNEASALSFDTAGKTGIIDIVTTDGAEGVTMSGTLDVTGDINGLTLTELGTGFSIAGGSSTEKTLTVSEDSTIDQNLATTASPTWAGITVSGLTASRLVATNGAKALSSVADLTSWIAGTTNRVSVTSDGDGTVTLSTPQDLHTGASPQFTGLTLTGALTLGTGIKDSNVTTAIPFGDASNTGLDDEFNATSIIGALNELQGGAFANVGPVTVAADADNVVLDTRNIGTDGGAIWFYSIKINGRLRSGLIMVASDGSVVTNPTDLATRDTDVGNDTGKIDFSAVVSAGDVVLRASNTDSVNDATIKVYALSLINTAA